MGRPKETLSALLEVVKFSWNLKKFPVLPKNCTIFTFFNKESFCLHNTLSMQVAYSGLHCFTRFSCWASSLDCAHQLRSHHCQPAHHCSQKYQSKKPLWCRDAESSRYDRYICANMTDVVLIFGPCTALTMILHHQLNVVIDLVDSIYHNNAFGVSSQPLSWLRCHHS